MQSTFPCPNPTCTHTFQPSAVQGASSLVCPRCGYVFQFGPSHATPARPGGALKAPTAAVAKPPVSLPKAPPPAPKVAAPVAAPVPRPVPPTAPLSPAVSPVAPPAIGGAVPVALPVGAAQPPSALNFNSTPDMVVGRVRRGGEKKRKLRMPHMLALSAVALLGVAVAVWGGLWFVHFNKKTKAEDDPVRAASLFNFRFNWPDRPWKREKDIELKLHVNLGMRAPERNNCMGLFFKDYKTRLPSEAEMVDEALGKLRSYFQGVEWEFKPKEKVQLAERPALLLEFQGEDAEHVQMNGECYMLAFRGYAYWFFTWGPVGDREMVAPEWDGLREQFSLLDGRKGWTEKPRESERVQGTKAKYQLTYVKELWTRKPSAQDYDPLADLVLQGDEPDPDRKKISSKTATLQVLVLPKQEDLQAATAAARDYLQKREEKDYPMTKMEVVKDKNGDVDRNLDIGNERGHLSKLRVKNTEDLERFLVVAVVTRPDGVLVLLGDCLWERRDFWDQEFMPLINSLRVR